MRHLYGADVWQFRADKPEETTIFNAAMSALARNSFHAIVDAYDFDRFERIVDVGGGTGTLLTQILAVYLHPRGVVFDLPHVVQEATAEIDRAGLAHRCDVDGGSYLDGVPEGGDLYILKSVLMDCPDDQALVILRHIRQAMNGDGAVLVIETVTGAPNEGELAAFSDLNMLVATGGRVRARRSLGCLAHRHRIRFGRSETYRIPVQPHRRTSNSPPIAAAESYRINPSTSSTRSVSTELKTQN